jgi:hypothetical protein
MQALCQQYWLKKQEAEKMNQFKTYAEEEREKRQRRSSKQI